MTMTDAEAEQARGRAAAILADAGIALTPEEALRIEVADFGLGKLEATGLQLVTYVNTERCSAKELVLFDGQTCPEHLHPPFGDNIGKEETFRVRRGTVFLYVEGAPTADPRCVPARAEHYTVWHEVRLEAGEQYTIPPGTRHWFQAVGGEAVVSEFATMNCDEFDVFTDPDIRRVPAAD